MNEKHPEFSRRDFVKAIAATAVVASAASVIGGAQAADGGQPVEFMSKGLKCKGLKYLPADYKSGEKRACIVLAHGFSAVKEMYFTDYAQAFAKAGFVAVVFDYRFQGESEGEPRGQIIPLGANRRFSECNYLRAAAGGSKCRQDWDFRFFIQRRPRDLLGRARSPHQGGGLPSAPGGRLDQLPGDRAARGGGRYAEISRS